jgi:hypothetical protein
MSAMALETKKTFKNLGYLAVSRCELSTFKIQVFSETSTYFVYRKWENILEEQVQVNSK